MLGRLKHYWRISIERSPQENLARLRLKRRSNGHTPLTLPTVDDWWELSRVYPALRRTKNTLLKDYGYLRLLTYLHEHHPKRVLEFGHGLRHGAEALLYTRTDIEMWACDDWNDVHYHPSDPAEWEQKYLKFIAPYPQTHFVRCLVGDRERTRNLLPERSFDLVCSVSVIEELDLDTLARVLAHSYALLAPGGRFLASHDIRVRDFKRFNRLIDAVHAAGFEWNVDRDALPWLNWDTALLEGQDMVMLHFQSHQGEKRHFGGNWTTLIVDAGKPRTNLRLS